MNKQLSSAADHGICQTEILIFKTIKLKFPRRQIKKDFKNRRTLILSQSKNGKYRHLLTECEATLEQIRHLQSVVEMILVNG